MKPVFIVFDGPPSNDSGRFVEVETADGKSVSAGEWKQDGEYWNLGPFYTADQLRQAKVEAIYAALRFCVNEADRQRMAGFADEIERSKA